jgi:hypothetical protein
MNSNVVHVGLDVDDTQYHGAALNKATGELFHFKCRPTLKGLLVDLHPKLTPELHWILTRLQPHPSDTTLPLAV